MVCGRLKLLVNCQELLAQVRFAGGEMFSKPLHGNRPMLKTAFGEDWHFKSRDRSHASGNNLPFQRIEPLLIVIRQRDEWDSLRHLDDVWPREGAKTFEMIMFCRRISARVGAAETSTVGKRMFYPPDS